MRSAVIRLDARVAAIVLVAAVATTGCEDPDTDCYQSEPGCFGTRPDAHAVLTGTLTYEGPRPSCRRDSSGALLEPIEAIGHVHLRMWRHGYERPPRGEGTLPYDYLSLDGARLFDPLAPADCMPVSPTLEERGVTIRRALEYRWPSVRLDPDEQTRVVIEGFFDRDDDYVPLFVVRSSPTRGDVWGGVRGQAAAPLDVIELPSRFEQSGHLEENVDVILDQIVDTEVPMFRISEARPLSSEAAIPFSEVEMYELVNLELTLVADPNDTYLGAMSAGGIGQLDTSPLHFAWFARDFDFNDAMGNVGPDGVRDQHPAAIFHPSTEITWRYPVVSLSREQTEAEEAVDVTLVPSGQSSAVEVSIIPTISLLPSIRADEVVAKRALFPEVEITVSPAAVMWLLPGDLSCRVLIAPPGNPNEIHQDPDLFHWCHELPTGRYRVAASQGIAGGTLVPAVPERSEACDTTGMCFLYQDAMGTQSGYDVGQLWTVPNELGDTDEVGTAAISAEQGVEASLVIHDPNPDDPPAECARDAMGRQVDVLDRPIETEPIPDRCCAQVRGLCDLPLCSARPIQPSQPSSDDYFRSPREMDHGTMVRAITAGDLDPLGRPTCKPFELPPACCPD